jgi:UDP-GlcNAc:undecaprenyl-phosphate GlcNAc-1-phosphate transferase
MIAYALVAAAVLSFVLCALATPLSRVVAVRLGYVDVPGRHKAHAQPVPLLGGSAILAAILAPALLAMALVRYWAATGVPEWLAKYPLAEHLSGAAERVPMALGILLGAVALHVVGLIDDRRPLGPWTKLVAQLAVALPVVLLVDLRVLTFVGEPLSSIASVLWLLAIINAFNFLDNMDGLCAGVAAICCATLLGASSGIGQVFVPTLLALMLGAFCGYLVFNFCPATTFMGDAGSMVVGYLMGVVTMLTTYVSQEHPYSHYALLAPLVLMAVPLYDTVSVMVLRIRERVNPMVGDRRHFSHRLVRRGMSQRRAVLTIYLCTLATSAGALLLTRVDVLGAVLVAAQTAAVLLIVALLETGEKRVP